MKKILPALVLLILISHQSAYSQRITSTINDVTVYLQGALVSRNVQASLSPGNSELVIEGLSNFIDDKSVVLEGNGDATILSVNYRINYVKLQENNAAGQLLQNEIDSVKLKISFLQNERTTLNQELELLNTNHRIPTTDGAAFVDDLEDAADFYRMRATQVRNKITQLNIQEGKLNTKLATLQNQLNQDGNNSKLPSGEIVVKLNATSYTRTNFTLKYFVGNAGWMPSYTLRADEMNQPLNLSYDAIVKQQTGEQWKNVKLTLTTGIPSTGATKPQFSTWYVNIYQPAPQFKNNAINTYKAPTLNYDESTEGAVMKRKDNKAVDFTSNYTQMVQTSTNVNFEINLRYDVPSDGVGRHVRVQQATLTATFEYTAFPRQAKEAFLTANVTGWEDYGLLPGEASLFLGNTYVGKTFMDPNAAADTMSLFFGADKQLIADRTKVTSSSKKQFIGSNKTETFSYVITLRNAKALPVTADIIDQIPVSQNKDIEVELKESSKAEYDAATGKLRWRVSIQPGETKTISFQYSIKYPKNAVISNLY
ncbi:MAG: mucoidy inhibitor MuiA family protein [Bacteroidia bacterium]